jgi:tRNA A-37 threonylcarbamoyl transferase component Bud32
MDSLDLKANEVIEISGKCYRLIHLLGRGKGGYSWLADCDGNPVVVKQIHHEPCRVYSFGNKIDAERYAYERLKAIDNRIPKMLAIDMAAERLAKEYIEGPTIFELVRYVSSAEPWIRQVREMAEKAKAAGINIDYFSPNFVIQAHTNLLYYIDYECNEYSDEWNFENWGIKYWSQTPEFLKHLEYLRKKAEHHKE